MALSKKTQALLKEYGGTTDAQPESSTVPTVAPRRIKFTSDAARDYYPQLNESIRSRFANLDEEIPISSTFRTPEHNAEVGGIPTSKHLGGDAFDVPTSQLTPTGRKKLRKLFEPEAFQEINEGDHLHYQQIKDAPPVPYSEFDKLPGELSSKTRALLKEYGGDNELKEPEFDRPLGDRLKTAWANFKAPNPEVEKTIAGVTTPINVMDQMQYTGEAPYKSIAERANAPMVELSRRVEPAMKPLIESDSSLAQRVGGGVVGASKLAEGLLTENNLKLAALATIFPPAARYMAAGFTPQMLAGAVESGAEAIGAEESGDKAKAAEQAIMALGSLGLGGMAGRHAISGGPKSTVVSRTDVPRTLAARDYVRGLTADETPLLPAPRKITKRVYEPTEPAQAYSEATAEPFESRSLVQEKSVESPANLGRRVVEVNKRGAARPGALPEPFDVKKELKYENREFVPDEVAIETIPKKLTRSPGDKFNPETDSLSDLADKNGGVNDPHWTGEMDMFSRKEGLNLKKNDGKSLERIREIANENGYDFKTTDEVWRALKQDKESKLAGDNGSRVWSKAKQNFDFEERVPVVTKPGFVKRDLAFEEVPVEPPHEYSVKTEFPFEKKQTGFTTNVKTLKRLEKAYPETYSAKAEGVPVEPLVESIPIEKVADVFKKPEQPLKGAEFKKAPAIEMDELLSQAFAPILESIKSERGSISGKKIGETAEAVRAKAAQAQKELLKKAAKSTAEFGSKAAIGDVPPKQEFVEPPTIGKAGKLREIVQDAWLRQKKLEEHPSAVKGEDLTPYEAEQLIHGRTSFLKNEVEKVVKIVDEKMKSTEKKFKVSPKQLKEEVNLWLQAEHAPERNAALGEGAAGMTSAEAQSVLSDLSSKPYAKELVKHVNDWRQINQMTLDALQASGVVEPELVQSLRTKYQKHVPLQRVFEGEDMIDVLGNKGFDVRSTGLKKAKGSSRQVADIQANILGNVQEALTRSEKNRVDQATLKFARENPQFGLFEEIKPKVIGSSGEKPIFERIDDPQVLQLREGGKPVYLKIKDPHLAATLKGVNVQVIPPYLRFVKNFTKFFSQSFTRFDPTFPFSNLPRDLQGSAIHLMSQKGIGVKGAAKAIAETGKNVKAVIDYLRNKDTPLAKEYKEMLSRGGTTGGLALTTRENVALNLEKMRKTSRAHPLSLRKAVNTTLEAFDALNTVFEDSTRFGAYRAAKRAGASPNRAALVAKNATVNFNKMGTGGPIINALYMFSNASIQGSAKTLANLKNPKTAAAVIGGLGAASIAVNSWNDSVDSSWREKVSKWDLMKTLVVVLPEKDGTFRYMKMPIDYSITPIKVGFDKAYEMITGATDKSASKHAADLVSSILESYNPAGGTDLAQSLTPTIADVPLDILRNKGWHGGPIKPPAYQPGPEFARYFKSLKKKPMGEPFIKATKGMYKGIGIDVSPADVNYAYEQYIGGTGRFLTNVAGLGKKIVGEGEVELDEIPPLHRFYKTLSPDDLQNIEKAKYYENLNRVEKEKNIQKALY